MTSECGSTSVESYESDPVWEHNNGEDDDSVTCLFCNKVFKGGICEAKLHQIGGYRNVKDCTLCPQDVKDKLKANLFKIKSKKRKVEDGVGDDDDDVKVPSLVKKRNGVHIGGQESQEKRLKSNVNDACEKELRERAVEGICRFFYDAGIPLDAAMSDSFKEMIEAIGNYGPNLEPPSYYELRGPLLKKEVDNVNKWIEGHKQEWSKHGCSIMLDSWTDGEQRTCINVLVNSSKGSVFMESVDASSCMKSIEQCTLLDRFVERIGEANVVQVITDSSSKSVLAGKFLMVTRENLFWTPCAAHCIDLMLEDIGNIRKVKATIKRGIFLVGYIYNNCDVLNMMREFTNKELTRNGVTRFTTTYLTLRRLHNQKAYLTNMFTSEKWKKSVWAKETKGKKANEVVSMPSFWNNVLWTLKVMAPLVRVLRLVKNEKKPAMGYIYKAMDGAKEAIRAAFDKEDDCKVVYDIIDKRWECQLNHPLHAAGYFLNPELYCTNPEIQNDSQVRKGLYACIEKLFPSHDKQDLIMTELIKWMDQAGRFSDALAVKARGKIAPADWWKLYGNEIPNVQELAVKVLTLTCSSSCYKRNLNNYEHINSKKTNQLKHQKAQDLVFVKQNLTLKNRRDKDVVYDPISLEGIDYCNEWLIGKMEAEHVPENEDLTRVDAANANGAADEEDEEYEEDFDSSGEDMEDEEEIDNENMDFFDDDWGFGRY